MSVLFGARIGRPKPNTPDIDSQPNEQNIRLESLYDVPVHMDDCLPEVRNTFPRRTKKRKFEGDSSDAPTDIHYGIPIYKLLENVQKPSVSTAAPLRKRRRHQTVLLSEKYRPSRFIDLVGSDKTYRHILRWITQWRSIVFGTNAYEVKPGEHADQYGRPLRKILLVYGPPGIGKTTAAHVIAKQAGYDVLEINSSEERTANIVKERITSALQSHRVSSKRPVCLLLDEIDGATEHGFIRSLVNLINSDNRVASGKGRKNDSLLQRPIICVCNDPWTSSLSALRPLAEMVSFTKQTVLETSARLESICLDEGLNLTQREIQQIIQTCDCDLRACLNAIDFGSASSKNRLRASVADQQFSSNPATFTEIEASDMEKTLMSCFHSYPRANYIDDMLAKPCAISEWLALVDTRRHISAPTEIQTAAIHAFGQLFRSAAANSFITKQPNLFETTKRVKGVAEMIRQRSVARAKSRMTTNIMLKDFFPYLAKIACPITHAVPFDEDKTRIRSICESLTSMGVSLKGEKLDDGSLVFLLDPPLEQTCVIDEDEKAAVASGKFTARRQMRDEFNSLKRNREGQTQGSSADDSLEPVQNIVAGKPAPKSQRVGFFGNVEGTDGSAEVVPRSAKVWVQYMEGFSNAVRKPVSWNELFKPENN